MGIGTFVQDFIKGFSAYLRVLPLFSKLKLWKYVLLTAGMSLLLLVILATLAFLATSLGVWSGFLIASWMPDWLAFVIPILTTVFVVASGVLLFKHLILIAASPWMGGLAAKVSKYESNKLGLEPTQRIGNHSLFLRSLRVNTKLLVSELAWTVVCLLFSIIPVIGIAGGIGLLYVQAYFVGAGVLDYGLERDYDYSGSLRYLKSHRGLALGLGAGFVLQLLTIVGFLIAPSWSAAAAAYAYEHEAAANSTKLSGRD